MQAMPAVEIHCYYEAALADPQAVALDVRDPRDPCPSSSGALSLAPNSNLGLYKTCRKILEVVQERQSISFGVRDAFGEGWFR